MNDQFGDPSPEQRIDRLERKLAELQEEISALRDTCGFAFVALCGCIVGLMFLVR